MNSTNLSVTLPVLPIKRTVLFPGILMPVTVGRERSVAAVNAELRPARAVTQVARSAVVAAAAAGVDLADDAHTGH